MPIYEYKCEACGHVHEVVVLNPNADACMNATCPACLKGRLERIMSVPAAPQFKGIGWYETDYKEKK